MGDDEGGVRERDRTIERGRDALQRFEGVEHGVVRRYGGGKIGMEEREVQPGTGGVTYRQQKWADIRDGDDAAEAS